MPVITPLAAKGNVVHKQAKNILAVVWKDKREVSLLYHSQSLSGWEREQGPTYTSTNHEAWVCYWLQHKHATYGQLRCNDFLHRLCSQNTESSFFHLFNLAMLTPHIIHIINSRKKCKLEKNVVEGIRQPLSEHTVERPSPGRHSASGDHTRLTARHFKMTLDAPLQSKKKTSAKSLLRV